MNRRDFFQIASGAVALAAFQDNAIERAQAAAESVKGRKAEDVARVISFILAANPKDTNSAQEIIDRLHKMEGRDAVLMDAGQMVLADADHAEIGKNFTQDPNDEAGATIKDLVNESLIVALREGRTTITWADVLKAKLAKSVGPSEGVEYIERERHAVALHEACHAVISYLVQKRNVIDTATIQKGADYLGFVKPIPIEEQFTSWRSEYEADIMVSLASLVGERMFFDGDSSSGVSGDLQNATMISLAMEGLWGMGGQYGSYAATRAPHDAHPVADGNDRNVLETALGRRAEALAALEAEAARALPGTIAAREGLVLNARDAEKAAALFIPDGWVESPFLGRLPVRQYIKKVADASKATKLTVHDVLVSAEGHLRAVAYYLYDWRLKDGSRVSFDCADVFNFDPSSGRLQSIVLVYDTHLVRDVVQDKYP